MTSDSIRLYDLTITLCMLSALMSSRAPASEWQVTPGNTGNSITLEVRNSLSGPLPGLLCQVQSVPDWVMIESLRGEVQEVAPDSAAHFVLTFAIKPGAKSGTKGVVELSVSSKGVQIVTRSFTLLVAVPEKFELERNYPNPFNPSTKFAFALPEDAQITLKVFDLLGREVKTLVDEGKQAGNYEVEWDGKSDGASLVASGVYIYRIVAIPAKGGSTFVDSKRMLLIK